MTTKTKARVQQKKSIAVLSEEHKSSLHNIRKTQVNIKAAEGSGVLDIGGVYTPDEDQLEKINQYTRTAKTADELACFPTMSMNDLLDRDDDRFTTDTVAEFATLPPPYSFNGKSFMADHDYQVEKIRGRIFDTSTESVEGALFLTNQIYVPNTEQYAKYLENVDYGLAWAVSVGVVIDKANCAIPGCGEQVFSSRFFGDWCAAGHEKGYYYVPGEEQEDGWGFYLPVDPETKGAVKATVDLSDAIDAYELSQVFLGAQYMAELSKKPTLERAFKAASAASAKGVPVIGLGREEAKEIPLPHEDEVLVQAREKYTVTNNNDGDSTWTDADGFKWVYTLNASKNTMEAMCLGRSADDAEEQPGGTTPGEELRTDGPEVPGGDDEPGAEPGSEDGPVHNPEEGDPDGPEGPRQELIGEQPVSKKQLEAAMRAAKLPSAVIDAVGDIESDDLAELLGVVGNHMTTQAKNISELTPRADMGDRYLKSLRTDALTWYMKAHQDEEGKPVSTDSFTKMLDRIADDEELLLAIIEENKQLAKAKFPAMVRRSTFESNHTPDEVEKSDEGSSDDTTGKFARHIHG